MESIIATNLQPAYSELYLSPLRDAGLRVYTKDLNVEGWIRIDIFLVYDDPDELKLAMEIVNTINL